MTGSFGFTQNVSYIPFINFIMKMASLPFKKREVLTEICFISLNQTEKNLFYGGIYEIVPV